MGKRVVGKTSAGTTGGGGVTAWLGDTLREEDQLLAGKTTSSDDALLEHDGVLGDAERTGAHCEVTD
jgi:hypothetical protein